MRNDLLVIARFKGKPPSDALVLKCRECNRKGLCRPKAKSFAESEAKRRGFGILVLCERCARKAVRAEMLENDIEVVADKQDASSAVSYVQGIRREFTESN